jgi:xylulokinase
VGLTSQVNTHVFVDRDGRPLAPAITWADTRAADTARALDARISPEERLAGWPSGSPPGASAWAPTTCWT